MYSLEVIKSQGPVFLQASTTDINKENLLFANAP